MEKNGRTKTAFFTLVNSEHPLIWGFSIIGVIQRLIQNPVKHIRCGDFWENCIRLKVVNYF